MPPIRHRKKKSTDRPSLDDILEGPDEFGLLEVEAKPVGRSAPLEVTNFEALSQFVDQHGRLPSHKGPLQEKLLARRLSVYQENRDLHVVLKPYDRHRLLDNDPSPDEAAIAAEFVLEQSGGAPDGINAETPDPVSEAENVTSLDDIFSTAAFAELDLGDRRIFNIKHVPEISHREAADEIAQRTVCHNFYEYEHIFRQVHEGLRDGTVEAVRFQKATQVSPGDVFILEGILCLIDEVGEYREDGEGRYDPRLRVIFENGTESNHLLRSLAKRLYVDDTGRRVLRDGDSVVDAFNNISHKDKRSGEVYFVRSLSENPTLKAIPNLIKIGYTEYTVEERIKNAHRDIAFLEAPVQILGAIECYNLNPNKFESLIHGFLHSQRLKITLPGRDGKTYQPKEWFSVSLSTAREVVRRILDGSIVHYRMDNTTSRLVKKRRQSFSNEQGE